MASELDADRPAGEGVVVGARAPSLRPPARRPPPAPPLRPRCHRRGLPSFGQNDTPAAASIPKDHLGALPSEIEAGRRLLPIPTLQQDAHPRCGLQLEGDRQHSGLCASSDPPPARRKEERPCAIRLERSPPAGPIPASLTRPMGLMPTDLPPEGRAHPPCSLPPEGSHRQASPPASRKDASPAAASGWKRASRRPPAQRTDATPPCGLQTERANAQTPIWLRSRASLDCIQGRAASSVKPPLSPEARTALSLRTEFRHRQRCALRLERLSLR